MAVETASPRITDAVVLAAGYGERMRPLTLKVPKPAIHFLNRPAISHVLDNLAEYGVKRVLINTHHLPEKIVEAASPYLDRMEIIFSHEPEILGTAGLFFNLKEKLRGPFFVLNGDIFLKPPLGRLQDRLFRGRADAVLLLKKKFPGRSYTPVKLETDGTVSSIGSGDHFFCGVYAARPSFIEPVTREKKEDLVPLLLKPAVSAGKAGGEAFEGSWHDLGSPNEFLDATRDCLGKMSDGSVLPPSHSRLIFSDSYTALVDQSTPLDRGVKLTGFVTVAESCSVGKGAVLENSVLLPGTAVKEGAEIRNSIVSGNIVMTA